MFDPSIGKWISEDPEGFAAGDANLYRYVGNAPTDGVDPSGLDKEVPFPNITSDDPRNGKVIVYLPRDPFDPKSSTWSQDPAGTPVKTGPGWTIVKDPKKGTVVYFPPGYVPKNVPTDWTKTTVPDMRAPKIEPRPLPTQPESAGDGKALQKVPPGIDVDSPWNAFARAIRYRLQSLKNPPLPGQSPGEVKPSPPDGQNPGQIK